MKLLEKVVEVITSIPVTEASYPDAKQLICGVRADVFAPGKPPEQISKPSCPIEKTHTIELTSIELMEVLQGVLLRQQYKKAEEYIQESVGKNISSNERWRTVSEIMLLKTPGEPPRLHNENALHHYYARLPHMGSRAACQATCNEYKFSNYAACAKWIGDEITRKKKELPDFFDEIFKDIKKPSKAA